MTKEIDVTEYAEPSASWEYWKNGKLVASGNLCDHPCDEYLEHGSCKCADLSVAVKTLVEN